VLPVSLIGLNGLIGEKPMRSMFLFLVIFIVSVPATNAAHGTATVLYQGAVVEVATTLPDATDLWIAPGELTRVNGFKLKPEGACIDDICVPVRQDQDSEIFIRRAGVSWFNVSELASRLKQAQVTDYDQGVWSFGAIPARRASLVNHNRAPDFTLQDKDGNAVQLSDFKGKKIMLLTWASW
jgi:hypothetical protein